MRTPFDWFAKHLIASALRDAATVQTEREVSSEVQAIDAWVRPNPRGESARKRAGLLGRLAERTCLIEAFHKPPSSMLIRSCLQKLLALDAELRREAKRVQEKPAPLPRLWIVTAGDPARARKRFGLRRMRDWPAGVYRAPPGFGLAMVVASELPPTRDTLLVRLMGAGVTLRTAIAELKTLPNDAWEWEATEPWLRLLRLTYRAHPTDSTEETEAVMDALQLAEDLAERDRWDGQLRAMARLFAKWIGRPLTEDERALLVERAERLGFEQVEQALYERRGEELVDWLRVKG